MTNSNPDKKYMYRAIELALMGEYTARPNPMVGCVIVKDGQIVGEGFHHHFGAEHAEVIALKQAQKQTQGADVYVSLEPCNHQGKTPPCSDALIKAKVKNVYIAVCDPNDNVAGGGIKALETAGIHTEICQDGNKARDINRGFFCRMLRKRPLVRIKMAVSMDGRTVPVANQSQWISNDIARQDVQLWRARSCALMIGSNTIMVDNPQMNVRLPKEHFKVDGTIQQPLRIVIDSQLRTDPQSNIYNHNDNGITIIATTHRNTDLINAFEKKGIKVICFEEQDGHVPLDLLLEKLAKDYEVNEIQVEGGATLASALLEKGLCDEMLIYTAPMLIGSQSLSLLESTKIHKSRKLVWDESVLLGDNTRMLVHFEDFE